MTKRLRFDKVELVDVDHIHMGDAIRAAFMPSTTGVSATALKLGLLTLASHINCDGGTWKWDGLTMQQWANEIGCSVRHARRIRVVLEAHDLIRTAFRAWNSNEFELNVKAIISLGVHGFARMESQRARKRSESVLGVRDSAYHQSKKAEKDAEILAGATEDAYVPEDWRKKSVGLIFQEAFAEWPELAAGQRAGKKLYRERIGEDRSPAAWYRDCALVAEMLRTQNTPLVAWALRGATPKDGSRALRISSAAGWGQLLGTARKIAIVNIHGLDLSDSGADAGPIPVFDFGSGVLPTPLGSTTDAWYRVRELLAPTMTDERADDVWLSKGRSTRIEDGHLVVEFPNRLYVEYVVNELVVDWEVVDIPIRVTCSE